MKKIEKKNFRRVSNLDDKRPTTLKEEVRRYIYELGGIIQEEPKIPRLEFAFKFLYPNQKGKDILIVKPQKKDFIEISSGTNLSDPHKKAFEKLSNKEKIILIRGLQKIICDSYLLHNFIASPERVGYVIIDKIFIKKSLSVTTLYKSLQTIFCCSLNCIFYMQDTFADETKIEDISSNLYLYTDRVFILLEKNDNKLYEDIAFYNYELAEKYAKENYTESFHDGKIIIKEISLIKE